MTKRFVLDENQALRVFSILHNLWEESVGVFSKIILPEDKMLPVLMPDIKGAHEEQIARVLFAAAIFMRGGIVSDDPLKIFPYLWNNYLEMFCPNEIALKWDQQRIEYIIKEAAAQSFSGSLLVEYEESGSLMLFDEDELEVKPMDVKKKKTSTDRKKIYKADEFAKGWYLNFTMVSRKFNGQVLKMFEKVTDCEEFFGKIRSHIFGMRRKILALFTIWLQKAGIIPIFPCPIPVDFHALRILIATGIFKTKAVIPFNEKYPFHAGRNGVRVGEALINYIMIWSQKFMTENELSHLSLNPALWVLSRELCAFNHQNTSKNDGQTLVTIGDLKTKGWPKKYAHPCDCCPLEKVCQLSIPAAPYYRWGLLILNGERVEFPQDVLFGEEFKTMPLKQKRNNRN